MLNSSVVSYRNDKKFVTSYMSGFSVVKFQHAQTQHYSDEM